MAEPPSKAHRIETAKNDTEQFPQRSAQARAFADVPVLLQEKVVDGIASAQHHLKPKLVAAGVFQIPIDFVVIADAVAESAAAHIEKVVAAYPKFELEMRIGTFVKDRRRIGPQLAPQRSDDSTAAKKLVIELDKKKQRYAAEMRLAPRLFETALQTMSSGMESVVVKKEVSVTTDIKVEESRISFLGQIDPEAPLRSDMVVEAMDKTRVLDVDFALPTLPWDLRLSVSVEKPLPPDVTSLLLQERCTTLSKADFVRYKKRDSFIISSTSRVDNGAEPVTPRPGMIRVDMTQVKQSKFGVVSGPPSMEVEFEALDFEWGALENPKEVVQSLARNAVGFIVALLSPKAS